MLTSVLGALGGGGGGILGSVTGLANIFGGAASNFGQLGLNNAFNQVSGMQNILGLTPANLANIFQQFGGAVSPLTNTFGSIFSNFTQQNQL